MTMPKRVSVSATELHAAFAFVSAGELDDHSAYISLDTGKIFSLSDAVEPEEEYPDDLEISDRYFAVPHQKELDLGRRLAPAFIDQQLPDDYQTVAEFFRRKEAYSRFKQLLASRDVLQRWHEYGDRATDEALRSWCEENGIQLG